MMFDARREICSSDSPRRSTSSGGGATVEALSFAFETAGVTVTVKPARHQHTLPRFILTREFDRLWLLARYGWSRGARPWLGVATALAAVLVAALLHVHTLRPELWRSGDVYATLPIASELARLPMSLLFPTAYLPLWAACLQLLVVVGMGELILGRWITIVVALVGHAGSTLIARVVLESVHGHVLGLTPALAHVLDTGPSAATTAVGACLLVAAQMNRCALLLGAVLITAAIVVPGVDGVEHAAALVWGVLAGVVYFTLVARASTHGHVAQGPWASQFTKPRRAFEWPRSALASMREE